MKLRCLPCMLLFAWCFLAPREAPEKDLYTHASVVHPVVGRHGMVSTQQHWATKAGLAVLREGGNAIDAAVTVGFTLAVTLPRAGNLGGGGFMLLHLAESNKTLAIDYREKAPKAATVHMFLDEYGQVDPEKTRYSYGSVGVPGTVAALTDVLEKYGTISLKRALKPAIRLAEKGFPIDEEFAASLRAVKPRMAASPASMAIFYKPDGRPLLATGSPGGSTIITATLQTILNIIDFEYNLAEAAYAPRIHHQWFPDQLRIESSLNGNTRALLKLKGHHLIEGDVMGSTQSIMIQNGVFYGASDPRRPGALSQGY